MKQITMQYFQNEQNLLNRNKPFERSVYYTKDHKLVKEVPKHRLNHREAAIDSPDRDVVIRPNNIEFFYAEEETSARTYRIESFLEKMYRTLVWVAICSGSIALFLHFRQRRAMH